MQWQRMELGWDEKSGKWRRSCQKQPPLHLLCPPNLLMGPELVLIPTKRWLPHHLGKVHHTLIQNQLPHLCVLLAKSPQECCYINVCT